MLCYYKRRSPLRSCNFFPSAGPTSDLYGNQTFTVSLISSSGRVKESMASPPQSTHARFLVIFDFDETIIKESSDDAVIRLAPGGVLPDRLLATFRPGQYHEHSQAALSYLAQHGVGEPAIHAAIEGIPASPGIPELLAYLGTRRRDVECAVLSDANVYFIETWLRKAGARHLFDRVFTNPGEFDKDGRLVLRPYHAHSCQRCPENMCKQVILREYLARRNRERGTPFRKVFYIGDGGNDVCPTTALGPEDVAFPRKDYPMHRIIQEMQKMQPGSYKPTVVPWARGEDVVDWLKKVMEER